MNEIVPAILTETYEGLTESLDALLGVAPWVQIDVCDGVFVPTRTWPMHPEDRAHFAQILKGEEGLPHWEDFNFEVDLMVHHPEKHIANWIPAGIARAVIHLESEHNWDEVVSAAGDTVELGLAIDLDPPFEKLHAYVPRVGYLQIMGIAKLGTQGSLLDERVYDMIKRMREEFPDVTIQIDGGVAEDNARALLDVGADRLIVGSHIVHADSPKAAYKTFQNL